MALSQNMKNGQNSSFWPFFMFWNTVPVQSAGALQRKNLHHLKASGVSLQMVSSLHVACTCATHCGAVPKHEKRPKQLILAVFHVSEHCSSAKRRCITVKKLTPFEGLRCKPSNGVKLTRGMHLRYALWRCFKT